METAPSHLDPEEIRDALMAVEDVVSVHCLHVWTIGSGEVSLSSHLVIGPSRDAETLLDDVRQRLSTRFAIDHTTIQIEAEAGDTDPSCADGCEP